MSFLNALLAIFALLVATIGVSEIIIQILNHRRRPPC